jgi:hypothetical protein
MDSHPVLSRVQVSRHLVHWLKGEKHTLPSGIKVMTENLGRKAGRCIHGRHGMVWLL